MKDLLLPQPPASLPPAARAARAAMSTPQMCVVPGRSPRAGGRRGRAGTCASRGKRRRSSSTSRSPTPSGASSRRSARSSTWRAGARVSTFPRIATDRAGAGPGDVRAAVDDERHGDGRGRRHGLRRQLRRERRRALHDPAERRRRVLGGAAARVRDVVRARDRRPSRATARRRSTSRRRARSRARERTRATPPVTCIHRAQTRGPPGVHRCYVRVATAHRADVAAALRPRSGWGQPTGRCRRAASSRPCRRPCSRRTTRR